MTEVELSELLRNYAIVVGGFVGLGIALWRGIAADRQSKAASEQAIIGRRAHITEVFADAVGQLGDTRLEIRLGAIYALKRISYDFPDFADPVFELLSAYARDRASRDDEDEPGVDIQEISEFLRERLIRDGPGG